MQANSFGLSAFPLPPSKCRHHAKHHPILLTLFQRKMIMKKSAPEKGDKLQLLRGCVNILWPSPNSGHELILSDRFSLWEATAAPLAVKKPQLFSFNQYPKFHFQPH